jgi:hypothetical protein
MKVGRNDLCPCGSGKKYKKCCLAREEAARPPSEPEDDGAILRQRAMKAVSRFAARPELARAREEAMDLFRGEMDGDIDDDLLGDVEVKFAFFLLFDHELDGGDTLAERFLRGGVEPVALPVQRMIQRLAAARLRPYEVEEVRPEEGLALRDLWSGGRLFVTERAGTRQTARWDVLAARVAPEDDGTSRFEGGLYLIPTRLKRPLLDALKKEERRLRRRQPALDEDRLFKRLAPVVHQFWLETVVWAPRPSFVTAEGDALVFGKVVFDVLNREGVETALAGHPEVEGDVDGGYMWREEADKGFTRSLGRITFEEDRLVLEVTSRQRAARGRRLLEKAARDAIRYRATRFESPQKAMERARGGSRPPADESSEVPAEEAARVLAEYKQRHYATWPDVPLPALDGRTPRAAARLNTLRPRLVDLLKDLENHEARATKAKGAPYDFGWIWAELRLERST